MAVCLYSLNISHHGIVNCKRGEDRYEIFTQPQAPNVKLRPEHPGQHSMGKSQHLTMMDLRSGDLPQLVKVKTHIPVLRQKVYKLLLPMSHVIILLYLDDTHFLGRFFCLSLSLFFSLYAYVFMHLYIEPFWRHSPDISMFQSNS